MPHAPDLGRTKLGYPGRRVSDLAYRPDPNAWLRPESDWDRGIAPRLVGGRPASFRHALLRLRLGRGLSGVVRARGHYGAIAEMAG